MFRFFCPDFSVLRFFHFKEFPMTRSENPDLSNVDLAGTRRRSWPFLLVVVGLSVLVGWFGRRLQDSRSTDQHSIGVLAAEAGPPAKELSQGAVLYHVHCAKCHGADGRGDPEAMARLHPPPRDFAERPWRFEMTADSIRRVIADGIPGTSMAAQRAALAAADLDLLAGYVLHMLQQLPVVERTFTPEQRQLAALGFEVERRPFPAPKLTVKDASANSRSLSDFQCGWVILEFWGIHCEPCRRALPALQRLSTSEIGQHVQILPVCADADDAAAAQDVLTQIAPGLTACVDATGIEISRFNVQALPTTWLIDPAGSVCATHVGRVDWDSTPVRAAFEKLVSGNRLR
jgi:mono/diheme cytochrome c family protein/thiol-disulfide isomerase/thioredoxin